MRMIWNKGHRIRASDKHLVYHFSIETLLFVFVAVLLLLNSKQLMRTDWEHFSLLDNGFTLSLYNFITILIATGVCALVAFLYYRFCYDSFKKLLHRQKLARMILENKWYEADTVQDSGFFTDLQSRSREKIVWFPKIYYQMEKGLLHIRCEITLGKYQDQLLRLEDKLESGLYCELTDKTLHDGYIEYTLLYDMIANRITIDEVRAENGCLRLMKNLVWEYDALPHALIAGGTGGGKTYFLLTLIEALLHTNAVLYILDPKNADLADLGTVMGNVYHTKEEMIDCVNAFYEGMVQRSEEMKRHPNYKTGENYAYLGLPPCFLIFDEYVAFFEMLGTKESVSLLSQLKKIVMLGRQAGYFLIVACQRPDAKYFSDGIRDNFNFRVGLGRISELGYDREYMGRTLYLGSLKSDVYFCIYEKDYEQYVKLGTPLEEADIINRFEIRLRNERAYYAVRDLLTYYDAEQTAFSIINQYVRFVDEEADKRKNDWKLNDRWAWFIGDNRQSLKLTTKPEPYTLDRTLRWVQRQVAPTLKMLKKIDKGNGTDYMETIEQQAKLTEKHEMIIKQQTTPAKDLVES